MPTNIKDLLGNKWKDDMTSDEIVAALQEIDLPQDNTDEITRLRNALTKSNAEAAENKRKLKEHMSEEEQKRAEEAERIAAIERENQELTKRIKMADFKAKFLTTGMDDETATASAQAAYEGDIEKVITNFNNRIATVKESVRAELLNSTPQLQGGNTEKVKDFTPDIDASLGVGDFAKAAALMRVAQEQNIKNK
jgi:flagellar biosynthesis GTPase FlhF